MTSLKLIVAISLATASLAAPTSPAVAGPAPAGGGQGANAGLLQFCYDLIESGTYPELVLGECTSFNLTPDPGFKAHLCDYIRSNDLWDDFGVDSYSDCIRNVSF